MGVEQLEKVLLRCVRACFTYALSSGNQKIPRFLKLGVRQQNSIPPKLLAINRGRHSFVEHQVSKGVR